MKARKLHPWRVSHADARAIQEQLRSRLVPTGKLHRPRTIAAADVAYSRLTHTMYAAVIVCDAGTLEPVARALAVRKARFPYIPGLFSFREVPPLLAAFAKVKRRPDVILFDGQGQAHPRRFGLACHAGLLLDVPTIGCAKSRLVGTHDAVGNCVGDWAAVHDGSDIVGAALRTRVGTRPVYVSTGHRIDLATAIDLVLFCVRRYRLPEPLRLAHQATTALMRRVDPTARRPRTRGYPDFIASDGDTRATGTPYAIAVLDRPGAPYAVPVRRYDARVTPPRTRASRSPDATPRVVTVCGPTERTWRRPPRQWNCRACQR